MKKTLKISKHYQTGAGHLLLFAALVVVAAIAAVGYRVVTNQDHATAPSSPTASQTAPPTNISQASDLNTAQTSVSQAPVESDLNPDQMSADVNALY